MISLSSAWREKADLTIAGLCGLNVTADFLAEHFMIIVLCMGMVGVKVCIVYLKKQEIWTYFKNSIEEISPLIIGILLGIAVAVILEVLW